MTLEFSIYLQSTLFNIIMIFLGDIEAEEPELALSFKQRLGTLSSCWAQLSHKAQTIFQVSTKTEVRTV